jgi:hypothetical protein
VFSDEDDDFGMRRGSHGRFKNVVFQKHQKRCPKKTAPKTVVFAKPRFCFTWQNCIFNL